jgi:hypothetical protein
MTNKELMADDNSLNLRYYMNGTVDTITFCDQTLTDDQIEFMTTNLPSKCRKVRFLRTELTDIGISHIAENLLLRRDGGSNLMHLCLSGASVTDEGVNSLCNALLAGNNKLQSLNLELNERITFVGARALAEMLKMNNQGGCLEVLDISYTMIGRNGVYAVCKSLENNIKLKQLDITGTLTIEERKDEELKDLLQGISERLQLIHY